MSEQTTVAFVSLGCAKNLVDSEKMLGQLAEAGCALTNDESDADVIVVNTCGFLAESRIEAVDVIREAVSMKQAGRCRRVVVAGCLVQRDRDALLAEVPEIDALVGVNNRDDVARAVLGNGTTADRRGPELFLSDYHPFVQTDLGRLRLTPRHYAYLRISEGCNQKCTFCTIPSIRGAMHCKPPEVILAEARELAADGVVELSLIGQDTTSYGEEFGEDYGLARLLRDLNAVDGLSWIRLMYVYPSVMTDAIIDAIADCRRVVKYIDIPLQHINDRMLKAMHRRVTRAETEALLDKLRARIPGVQIRTTMIAGFPGETDAEFDELVRFVQEARFEALGVFAYSQEPETPAGRMRDQVSEVVKRERVERLMLTQQQIAFELADARKGETFRVLVDGRSEDGALIARHTGQAPSVDSVTFVRSHAQDGGQRSQKQAGQGHPGQGWGAVGARAGEFLDVRCIGRNDYDLVAVGLSTPLPVLD